jgi:hypothetical protein
MTLPDQNPNQAKPAADIKPADADEAPSEAASLDDLDELLNETTEGIAKSDSCCGRGCCG